ncbi:proline dehydrogenase family protein [Halorientalis pallida]|uniref:proline dehydrogenase n=1 Tax=Halorientalis pallida TaxID=2479928 RepID=A0A498KYQ6_9EURY|nr:proline dehydrogenase family protein [Halorientalis pallida]RXK50489.1 proline dehydrogenase [Halorientalis pallida]
MIPPIARRFVAGETEATALERARRLDERGVGAILNHLGEHYDERDPADEDADTYCRLIDDIAGTDLRACISVKPSQIGLDVSESVFRENCARIVDHADTAGVFVWFDMEDHTTTDATLDAFEAEARAHDGGVGVCLQANLRRTPADLSRLADCPGKVRLVKGAYDPPAAVALPSERVDDAYRKLLAQAFAEREGGIAVGSHDPAMIAAAERLHDEYGTPYEIQMLMGVREPAQERLAADHEVCQYVPYGEKWVSYFYRRVAERRANLTFALRAIVN